MTTIAYKNGVLAGDTQITRGHAVSNFQPKVFKIGDRLVGLAGVTVLAQGFVRWVENGMDMNEMPPMTDGDKEEESTATALVIADGKITEFSKWGVSDMPEQPYAIGSGAPFARTAMIMGATAEEAIRVAMEIDIYTGGEVQVVSK